MIRQQHDKQEADRTASQQTI